MIRPFASALMLCGFWATSVLADEVLPWLDQDKLPANMALVADEHEVVLRVTGPTQPHRAVILEAANPKMASHVYVLRGQIKYEGVEPIGFVEMWSHFGDNEAYFTRTLAPQGPMGQLGGASDWREVALPFTSVPGKLPTKLVVNVILPGKGTVFVKPFTLSSVAGGQPAAAQPFDNAWWSERAAGLIGGIIGGVLGLIGAVVGTLAGIGVARRVAVGLCVSVIFAGILSLLAGAAALGMGQPWFVYYPFLLGGVIGVAVCGLNLPAIRKRYDALELRRMAAMDA